MMEGQCYSFSSKTMLGRFYTVLVCLYPSQECSLGLGNVGLLKGVHATWDQGQWKPLCGVLATWDFSFDFSVKDTFNF